MKKKYLKRKLLKIISLLSLVIIILSCDKELDCENHQTGKLKNLTGFDGCGWLILLSDSTKLEPINLNDFDIKLIEEKTVCIQYHERRDLGSYCMVGKIVEIDFIEYN